MGTRADFYVGKGESAEWIGSIAWDGYPAGISNAVLKATGEEEFRSAVDAFFKHDRDDVTLPADGWPWPWSDSHTTDYAYCFDGGAVHTFCFGREVLPDQPEDDDDTSSHPKAPFPDMSARKNVTLGKRSGVIVVGTR